MTANVWGKRMNFGVGTGTRLLIGALVLYAAAIAFLVFIGGEAEIGPQRDTSLIADAPARAVNLLTAADQVIGMLFTTTVGIVVGIGFIFRDRDFRIGITNALPMVFVVVLMLAVIASIYFGYTARMHALRVAHYSLVQYTAINIFIGRQALSVVVAAGAALGLFMVYLAEKHLAPATATADLPAAAPPKPRRPARKTTVKATTDE